MEMKYTARRGEGVRRSRFLDQMWMKMRKYLERYRSGLDPEIINIRMENKRRILQLLSGSEDDWKNYKWHFKNVFKGEEGLRQIIKLKVKLSEEEVDAISKAVENQIPWGITPYYLHLFQFNGKTMEDLQVRKQVIPSRFYVSKMIEHLDEKETYFDFMGEHDTTPCNLITRRYVTIAIIKPYDSCPQICVYCQRNWMVKEPFDKAASHSIREIDEALNWFPEHEAIREILITGGDPFVLNNKMIEYLLGRIAEIDHIESVRWGTRTLVTVPMRIDGELAEILGEYNIIGKRTISVVTHIESAYEITPEMVEAVKMLKKQGINIYNQQVYTLYTSRRFQTVHLRILLRKIGIDPYYTFYAKGKREHEEYLVPIARILQERKEEARLLPGLFRTDEPVFNVPKLGKTHLRAWQDRELIGITEKGERVYIFHPWEKGICRTEGYVYRDISIGEYLDKLKKLGENMEDYRTIWHYF